MLKKISLLSFALLSFSLTSCTSIQIPDEPICAEINLERGYCVRPVSGDGFAVDEENLLNGKTWWETRSGMIQMPIETYAAWKAFVIKVCKKHDFCDKKISNWERTLGDFDSQVQEIHKQ